MFKIKTLLSSLLIGLLAISCTDEGFETKDEETIPQEEYTNDYKTLKFTYKNEVYSSSYYEIGDSLIIQDNKTREIYNEIHKNEDILTVIDADENISYYDSEAEYEALQRLKPQLRNSSLYPYFIVTVRLYKNYNSLFTPTTSFLITKRSYIRGACSYDLIRMPDLSLYGHNDNISLAKISLDMGNITQKEYYRGTATLTLYRDINFYGKNKGEYEEGVYRMGQASVAWNKSTDMKAGEIASSQEWLKVKAKDGNGNSFNDKASSLIISIAIHDKNDHTTQLNSGRVPKDPNTQGETSTEGGGRSSSNPNSSSSTTGGGRSSSNPNSSSGTTGGGRSSSNSK